MHDASGELVRVCWLSVNIRGESTCGDGDSDGDKTAGVFPVDELSVRNTVAFPAVPGAAEGPARGLVPRCAGRRGECVYGLPPAVLKGPTCLNVDCD